MKSIALAALIVASGAVSASAYSATDDLWERKAAAAPAKGLTAGGPVVAQEKTAPVRIAPVEKPAPKPDGRGIIWAEQESI